MFILRDRKQPLWGNWITQSIYWFTERGQFYLFNISTVHTNILDIIAGPIQFTTVDYFNTTEIF